MKLIENLDSILNPFNKAVITIGNFDGVHNGHKTLLKQIIEYAKKINGTSVAITFEPHPIKVLKKNGNPPLITLYDQKFELIDRIGVDVLIIIPFTKDFAEIEAKKFVEDILIKKIGMKAIIVGNDYTFGKNRKGDINLLKTLSKKLNYELIIPDWIEISKSYKERISSTKIREIIMDGRVSEAPQLLGRYYQIRGKVVSGRNRGGKLLGFPTANIHLHDELCPKTGVYAVTVECISGNYKGVANIGYGPTFEDHIFTIEVHILNFNENIYNQRIRVNFVERLRAEKKFESIKHLSEQINKDIEKAKKILKLN